MERELARDPVFERDLGRTSALDSGLDGDGDLDLEDLEAVLRDREREESSLLVSGTRNCKYK